MRRVHEGLPCPGGLRAMKGVPMTDPNVVVDVFDLPSQTACYSGG